MSDNNVRDAGIQCVKVGQQDKKQQDVPGITMNIAVFFDGTRNNKNNTEIRKVKNSEPILESIPLSEDEITRIEKNKREKDTQDSYMNDYTNISLLFYNSITCSNDENISFSIYVPGVGTADYVKDNKIPGAAIADGTTGIYIEVVNACKKIVDQILDKSHGKKINKITFDLLGFSRGAASACNFIHQVMSPKPNIPPRPLPLLPPLPLPSDSPDNNKAVIFYRSPIRPKLLRSGCFRQDYFEKTSKEIEFNIEFRFAGLFDCVASEGIFKDSDIKELFLGDIAFASTTVHLIAADEHRQFFPLIDIHAIGAKGNNRFVLPGVHSDIGGGYRDNFTETVNAITIVTDEANVEKEMQELITQGWYSKEQLNCTKEYESSPVNYTMGAYSNPAGLVEYQVNTIISGKRILSNKYSYISLNIMAKFAKDNGVNIDFEKISNQYSIPSDLASVNTRIRNYIYDSITYPELVFHVNKKSQSDYKKEEKPDQMKYRSYKSPETLVDRDNEDNDMLYKIRNKYLHWSADSGSSNFIKSLAYIQNWPEGRLGKRIRIVYPRNNKEIIRINKRKNET